MEDEITAPQFPFLVARRIGARPDFVLAHSMTGGLPTLWTPHARAALRFKTLEVAAEFIVRFGFVGVAQPAYIADRNFTVTIPGLDRLRKAN